MVWMATNSALVTLRHMGVVPTGGMRFTANESMIMALPMEFPLLRVISLGQRLFPRHMETIKREMKEDWDLFREPIQKYIRDVSSLFEEYPRPTQ